MDARQRRPNAFQLSVLLLGVVLIGGCRGKKEEIRSESSAPDACVLLTEQDAREALGAETTGGKRTNTGGGRFASVSQCLYSTKDASMKSASLLFRAGASSERGTGAADRHAASIRKQFGQDYALEPVPGFGEGALWDPSLNQLTVFSGRNMAIVSVFGMPPHAAREKAELLANKVMEREKVQRISP